MKIVRLTIALLLLQMVAKAQWAASWNPGQNLLQARSQHQLLALPDGRVLAAGGWGGSIHLLNSEINDGGVNGGLFQWDLSAGPMNSAHTTGAGVLLNNGKAMIIGGYTGSANTNVCELYDTATQIWDVVDSLTQGRSFHTATVLLNGKVLVTGGYDGTSNLTSCELYDPIANSWTNTVSGLTTGRSYHTATLLSDGRVLIAGGFNPTAGFQLSSVEIYDPVTNQFSSGPGLTDARAWHAASRLADGRVLVSGGEHFNGGSPFAYNGMTSCEIYNPTSNSWTAAANLPAGACYNQQFTLVGNRVVMIAGAGQTNYSGTFTYSPSATYVYEVGANTWTDQPMTLDGRMHFAAAQINDSLVMVCGGIGLRETEYLKVDIQTGVRVFASTNKVIVYPNPGTGSVSFQCTEDISTSEVMVIDFLGKKTNAPIRPISNTRIEINLTGQPAGIYSVQFAKDGKNAASRKIVHY